MLTGIDTLVELTGFSRKTVLEQIFILGELGVFNVEYGEYNSRLKMKITLTLGIK